MKVLQASDQFKFTPPGHNLLYKVDERMWMHDY